MFLVVAQILVCLLLITCVLLQMQGTGLSNSFGGGGEFFRSKRSIEKLLYYLTIVLSISFAILSILLLTPLGR